MVALSDGRRVRIRALGPQDAAALGTVYAALDGRDQRMRFSRSGLPAAEAHALAAAELSQARCGVIAFDPDTAPPRPVAAAVCMPDGTGPAEVALAVLRSHQGARLGRALLSDLLAVARQARLPVLRAVIRRDNAAALALFRSLGCLLVERPGPDELVLEIATDGTMPGWPAGPAGCACWWSPGAGPSARTRRNCAPRGPRSASAPDRTMPAAGTARCWRRGSARPRRVRTSSWSRCRQATPAAPGCVPRTRYGGPAGPAERRPHGPIKCYMYLTMR